MSGKWRAQVTRAGDALRAVGTAQEVLSAQRVSGSRPAPSPPTPRALAGALWGVLGAGRLNRGERSGSNESICVYMCVCACMCVNMHERVYTYVHTCMNMCMCVCMHKGM